MEDKKKLQQVKLSVEESLRRMMYFPRRKAQFISRIRKSKEEEMEELNELGLPKGQTIYGREA